MSDLTYAFPGAAYPEGKHYNGNGGLQNPMAATDDATPAITPATGTPTPHCTMLVLIPLKVVRWALACSDLLCKPIVSLDCVS